METTPAKNGISQGKASKEIEEKIDTAEIALRERIEHARDMIEDLRDRAELAFHERPYLLPVATGALGLGIGVLIGSKVSRLILVTAAGALLSDTVRTQVGKLSREFIKDLSEKLDEKDEDDLEPSVT
jgi:hypothetical protein